MVWFVFDGDLLILCIFVHFFAHFLRILCNLHVLVYFLYILKHFCVFLAHFVQFTCFGTFLHILKHLYVFFNHFCVFLYIFAHFLSMVSSAGATAFSCVNRLGVIYPTCFIYQKLRDVRFATYPGIFCGRGLVAPPPPPPAPRPVFFVIILRNRRIFKFAKF